MLTLSLAFTSTSCSTRYFTTSKWPLKEALSSFFVFDVGKGLNMVSLSSNESCFTFCLWIYPKKWAGFRVACNYSLSQVPTRKPQIAERPMCLRISFCQCFELFVNIRSFLYNKIKSFSPRSEYLPVPQSASTRPVASHAGVSVRLFAVRQLSCNEVPVVFLGRH